MPKGDAGDTRPLRRPSWYSRSSWFLPCQRQRERVSPQFHIEQSNVQSVVLMIGNESYHLSWPKMHIRSRFVFKHPHKAKYIIHGNPGRMSRLGDAATCQPYPCSKLLQCSWVSVRLSSYGNSLFRVSISDVSNQPPWQHCLLVALLTERNLKHLGSNRCQ